MIRVKPAIFIAPIFALVLSMPLGLAASAELIQLTAVEGSTATFIINPDAVLPDLPEITTVDVSGVMTTDQSGLDWEVMDLAFETPDFKVLGGLVPISDVELTLPPSVSSLLGIELPSEPTDIVRYDAAQIGCECDDFLAQLSFDVGGTPIEEIVEGPVVFDQPVDFELAYAGQAPVLSAILNERYAVQLGSTVLIIGVEVDLTLVPEPGHGALQAGAGFTLLALARRRRRISGKG